MKQTCAFCDHWNGIKIKNKKLPCNGICNNKKSKNYKNTTDFNDTCNYTPGIIERIRIYINS